MAAATTDSTIARGTARSGSFTSSHSAATMPYLLISKPQTGRRVTYPVKV